MFIFATVRYIHFLLNNQIKSVMKQIIYIMLPIIASGIFGCSKSDNVYLSANGRNSSEGLKQSEITIMDDGYYILPDGRKGKIPMPTVRKAEE